MAGFAWRVRVYWEDTDAGGVVYYANYFRFLERARTEWLRARGFDQSALREHSGVVLVVRSVQADFLSAARLDDELAIGVRVEGLGAATVEMTQVIERIADNRQLLRAAVKAACLDAERWRPRRLPQPLRQAIVTDLP